MGRDERSTWRCAVRGIIIDGESWDLLQLERMGQQLGMAFEWTHFEPGASAEGRGCVLLVEAALDRGVARRVLAAVRSESQFDETPVLLSLQPDQVGWVEGTLGFDDFVLEPWCLLEVRARGRAARQRRTGQGLTSPDGIVVNAIAHEVLVDGQLVRLTAREFALFTYLRAHRGDVLSRQHLLARVWGRTYRGGARTVDTHVARLRLKLGPALSIETVRTNGYRLCIAATNLPATAVCAKESLAAAI
jgi:DNA-binding response OmpR family regulator